MGIYITREWYMGICKKRRAQLTRKQYGKLSATFKVGQNNRGGVPRLASYSRSYTECVMDVVSGVI